MINKKIFEFPLSYSTGLGRVAFGWGAHETVADECRMAGIKNAMITTTGLKGTGIVEEIKGILNYHGIPTVVYDKVTSNPKDYEVMEAYKIFMDAKCDGIVSIGGGSSHDCGKALRAVAANGGVYVCDMAVFIDPPWMEEMKKWKPVTIPQVSVNTTAGTGAESTAAAAIVNTHPEVNAKQLLIIPQIYANMALIDPYLIRMQPKHIAAQSGFDALAHAFESYICRMRSNYSWALMSKVIELVSQNLREFSYNRMNHKACENICWADTLASIGLSYGGGVGIVHGLSHGLSVLCNVHHGLANAVVAVPMERYNVNCCPEKFGEMARLMGVDTRNMTTMQAADKWFEEMDRLLKDLGIETGNLTKQFGLKKEQIPHIVKWQYEKDFAREGNPRDFNFAESVKLLEDLL
jgi:methanol:N,N-dimethyl-4-nitrosoaniline oxidoreductase